MNESWDIILDGFPDFEVEAEESPVASSYHLDRLRKHNIQAYKKRGLAIVVRGSWGADDVEAGLAIPCPECYEPAYKQTSNTNCPLCVGVGFVGVENGEGYADPVFTWGNIILSEEGFDKTSKKGAGEWETEGGSSSVCHNPIITPDDIIFTVDAFSGETALAVSGMFQVNGAVRYQTMRGSFTGIEKSTFRLEETLLYQTFNVKAIPQNDIRQTLAFS